MGSRALSCDLGLTFVGLFFGHADDFPHKSIKEAHVGVLELFA
jgi:hypothetical protein